MKDGRCLTCALLGRWQHGPLSWLQRRHLRRACRQLDQPRNP